MDDLTRRWVKPALLAVVVATGFWLIAGLLGLHTRLAVDIALALLLAALIGLFKDLESEWTALMPVVAAEPRHSFRAPESRSSLLRRMLADTLSEESGARPDRAAPAVVQSSLRAAAAHRVGRRDGVTVDPHDVGELTARLDRPLADYLCADPPPHVDAARLDDLIRRIEDL